MCSNAEKTQHMVLLQNLEGSLWYKYSVNELKARAKYSLLNALAKNQILVCIPKEIPPTCQIANVNFIERFGQDSAKYLFMHL